MNLVDMNIVDRRLKSIAEEMGIVLMKTSYSTIFNEGRDFTCGVADDSCELVASADFQPAQVGGMPLVVASIIKEISKSHSTTFTLTNHPVFIWFDINHQSNSQSSLQFLDQ